MNKLKVDKYPFKYNGDIEIGSFFDFLEANTTLKCVPMSKKQINIIQKSIPKGRKLPKQYLEFLKRAGSYFENWEGSDYIVITEHNHFQDFGDYLKVEDFSKDEVDYEFFLQFQSYGFKAEDCFFFFAHQGNAYAFFRLDDGDNPNVYWVGEGISKTGTGNPKSFANMIIQGYNETVEIVTEMNSSWFKIDPDFEEMIMEEIKKKLNYDLINKTLLIPFTHDKYCFQDNFETGLKERFEILRLILEQCVTEITSVYVYKDNALYIYEPEDDKKIEDIVDLHIEPVFFLSRDYQWGCLTNEKKIYVFGDKFRELVARKANELGLKRCI